MGYGARPILSRKLISDAGRQIVDAVQDAGVVGLGGAA